MRKTIISISLLLSFIILANLANAFVCNDSDFDNDGDVDRGDLTLFHNYWLQEGCSDVNSACYPFDLDNNGKVAGGDLGLFAGCYKSSCDDADFNKDGVVDKRDSDLFTACADYGKGCSSKFDLNGDGLYTIVGDVPCFNQSAFVEEESGCFISCEEQMKENCAEYPDSPICPENISRRCELNCQKAESVLLNEDFTLDIGKKIIVSNYDNMEITLLALKRTGTRQVTADLEIKKENETEFVSISSNEKKEVFGARIDFVTFIANYPAGYIGSSKDEDYKSAILSSGVFGVYEEGIGGFWSRVLSWIRRIF